LEATARAVQPVLEFGESGLAVADGLSNLLKVKNFPYWNLVNTNILLNSKTNAHLEKGYPLQNQKLLCFFLVMITDIFEL